MSQSRPGSLGSGTVQAGGASVAHHGEGTCDCWHGIGFFRAISIVQPHFFEGLSQMKDTSRQTFCVRLVCGVGEGEKGKRFGTGLLHKKNGFKCYEAKQSLVSYTWWQQLVESTKGTASALRATVHHSAQRNLCQNLPCCSKFLF